VLPVEWEERSLCQWTEELGKVEDKWPAEWKGRMPLLLFARGVEEGASGAGISENGAPY
jgi:hypothetical protein